MLEFHPISLLLHLVLVNFLAKNIAHGAALQNADKPTHQEQSQVFIDQLSDSPPIRSDRIVFAAKPPRMPPWSAIETGSFMTHIEDDATPDSDVTSSPPHSSAFESDQGPEVVSGERRRSPTFRARRSVPLDGLTSSVYQYADLQRVEQQRSRPHPHHQTPALQPVCPSSSEWVQMTEAEDFLGNRVQLVQGIDNGSSRVNQYIYETRCVQAAHHHHHAEQSGASRTRSTGSGNSCLGIDSTIYHSVCYDTHHLVYGLVSDYSRSGNGWTYIKVRSGCTCGLLEKRVAGGGFIDDGHNRHRSLRGRNYR